MSIDKVLNILKKAPYDKRKVDVVNKVLTW